MATHRLALDAACARQHGIAFAKDRCSAQAMVDQGMRAGGCHFAQPAAGRCRLQQGGQGLCRETLAGCKRKGRDSDRRLDHGRTGRSQTRRCRHRIVGVGGFDPNLNLADTQARAGLQPLLAANSPAVNLDAIARAKIVHLDEPVGSEHDPRMTTRNGGIAKHELAARIGSDENLAGNQHMAQLPCTDARDQANGHVRTSSRLLHAAEAYSTPMRFHSAVPIGRGGTGRVLRAYDAERGHEVALKLLHVSTPALVERLRREAAALARLDHPNIARILGSGEQDGQPYIAMQLIDGVALDRAVIGLNLERRIALLLPVIDAVHSAHRAGLVHRDLKPANLLVETEADGGLKPYVVDFGLVHGEDAETVTALTSAGEFLGTPGYLAPEQAAGEAQVDRRSDVFSLGVILYELSCGTAPFASDSVASTVVRLLRHEPPPPHRVDARVPLALSRIIQQCLDKEPARRYQSARALKDDLEAWLDGRPVQARRNGPLARAARWLRRSPARAAVLVLALALPLVAAATWLHARVDSARVARLAQDYATTAVAIARDLELAAMRPDQDLALHRQRLQQRLTPLQAAIGAADRNVRQAAGEALARALFALGDIEGASAVLEPIWREGPRTPALATLLGRVRERAYAEQVVASSAIGDVQLRRERLADLRERKLQPALALFALSADDTRSDARIGQALLAFHEGRTEQAQAILAAIDEPSLAAEQLAAQLRFDHALALADEAEPTEVEAALNEAERASADLAETARSLPAAHLGLCRVAGQRLRLLSRVGSDAPLPVSIPACDRARLHDSLDPAIGTASALAYGALARRQGMLDHDPSDAVQRVRDEVQRNAQTAAALALAQALITLSDYRRNRGDSVESLLAEAEDLLVRASENAPGDGALLLELGAVQQFRAIYGSDQDEANFARAATTLNQALDQHDGLSTRLRLAETLVWWGNDRYHRGQAPEPMLAQAIDLLAPAHERLPDDLRILQRLAFAHWTRGQHLAATGVVADADLETAEELYDRVLALDAGRRSTRFNRLSVQFTLARHRLQRGESAAPVLARARSGFPELDALSDDPGMVIQAGALRLLDARERKRAGDDAREMFLAARSLLGQALSHPRDRGAAASQLADLVISAYPDGIDDDVLGAELERVGQAHRDLPDNRVLALHHTRLLALAARHDPERWLLPAQQAYAEVEQHSLAYLAPFNAEFAALRSAVASSDP